MQTILAKLLALFLEMREANHDIKINKNTVKFCVAQEVKRELELPRYEHANAYIVADLPEWVAEIVETSKTAEEFHARLLVAYLKRCIAG